MKTRIYAPTHAGALAAAKFLLLVALLLLTGARTSEARFLSPDNWDPWLQGVDVNRYAYSGNDPINGSDPNGHVAIADDVVITGIVAIGATVVVGYHYYKLETDPNYKQTLTSTMDQAVDSVTSSIASIWSSDPYGSQTDQEIQDGIKSHEWQIDDHRKKLNDYLNDPDKHDNKGWLAGARTPEQRAKIIAGRVKTLQQTIEKHRKEILKKKEELKKREEERKKEKEEQDQANKDGKE